MKRPAKSLIQSTAGEAKANGVVAASSPLPLVSLADQNDIQLSDGGDILIPNPIRVETALPRFPVHRLSKQGEVSIDIEERSESGDVVMKWEVNFVGKFKQPGPLAYKLDTIVINRRIEEAPRPIPRIIRLGSLSEICRELGQADSGKNTNHLKNALKQNASAFITAKVQYRLADGTPEDLEQYFNRYSVVLKGEKLPDGTKAECVFIILSDVYAGVLNRAVTRPLDYDYLRMLPPASQRFYELISFQMYATIKNDRDRAKILYSELCRYAPLMRQTDWNVVRPQLARIHAPHRESGYITKVDSQAILDDAGKPDWVLLYQPGPKARAEFNTFAKRGGSVLAGKELIPVIGPPVATVAPTSRGETALIGYGVTATVAAKLVRKHGEEAVSRQIEYLEWELVKNPGKIDDPAAWLVVAINSDHAAPKKFISKAEQQRRQEAKQAKDRQATETRRQEREKEAAEQAEKAAILNYWAALTPQQQQECQTAADAQADPAELAQQIGPFKAFGQTYRRMAYIGQLLKDRQAEQA